MAIIKCVECNKEISDKASQCPHCGYNYKKNNNKKEKSTAFKIFIPIIVVIAVLVIGIVSLFALSKGIEKLNEKKILNQIVGTWQYSKVSKVNGGISYDIITFTENKDFKYTGGFIYESNSDFKYDFEGTVSIYEDGNLWLYSDNGEFFKHFKYDSKFDELYEMENYGDGIVQQYDRK